MRAVRPVIVVTTGRSGSTMLSNMVRSHPELLSLSELFILLGVRAFSDGPVSGPRFWEILSRPHRALHVLQRSGVTFPELLYVPGPGARFTVEAGVPPLMLVPLPHLVDDPEALFDEIGAWAVELDARPLADQYRRLFDWLGRRLGRRVWIERSGASLPIADVLAQQFPEAGIVHLYRDGRECAMSMSRHDGFKLMAFRHQRRLTPAGMYPDGRPPAGRAGARPGSRDELRGADGRSLERAAPPHRVHRRGARSGLAGEGRRHRPHQAADLGGPPRAAAPAPGERLRARHGPPLPLLGVAGLRLPACPLIWSSGSGQGGGEGPSRSSRRAPPPHRSGSVIWPWYTSGLAWSPLGFHWSLVTRSRSPPRGRPGRRATCHVRSGA